MINALQKIKLGGKKGFYGCEGEERLWLLEINLKVFRMIKGEETTQSIAKQHKKVLKFVKKEVTAKRVALFEQAESEKSDERKIKLTVEAKRALALEKMILCFALVMCLPEDVQQMSDTLTQLEELMECFRHLHLGDVPGRKQPMKSEAAEERKEALRVLFDFLISLLAKANSFLREIANYVFKQFCSELDEESLDQLLKVISTPNEKVAEMFEEGSDDYGSEGEVEDDAGSEEEDSD